MRYRKHKVECKKTWRYCREVLFDSSKCRKRSYFTKTLSTRKGVKGVFCRVKTTNRVKLQTMLHPKKRYVCRKCASMKRRAR